MKKSYIGSTAMVILLAGCSTSPSHPCLDVQGDPARDVPLRADRRCTQRRGLDGRYVNDGLYQEWHPNGKLALEGHFKMGKKDGLWTEYDPTGHMVSQKTYEDGAEVGPKPTR